MRASAGSITKLDNGHWRIRVTVGFDPKTGKPRRVSKNIRGSKRDAERVKATLLASEHPEMAQKLKVRDVVLEYLDQKKGTIREPTWQEYERVAQKVTQAPFSNCPIVRLETQEKAVREWLNSFNAPWTRKSHYKFLRQVLNYAKKQHYITVSVLDYIPEPKTERKEIETIPLEELRAYLDAVKGTEIEAGVLVMLFLGLRRSEALALKWNDVNLDGDEPTLTVGRSIRELKGGGVEFNEPKTAKSKRVDFIPAPCAERLAEIRRENKKDVWVCQFENDVMRPDYFSRAWKRYVKKAGLKPIIVKNLRHSCGTMLVRDLKVELSDVAELLGHSSIRTTEQFYLQSSNTSKKRTAEAWSGAEFWS